jgi:hypothetical protein
MVQEATRKRLCCARWQTLFRTLASLCCAAICRTASCVLSARRDQAMPPAIAQA